MLVVVGGSELHASPHIHIWIGHTHIWIYMDPTIWEMLYMWASMKFLPVGGVVKESVLLFKGPYCCSVVQVCRCILFSRVSR